MPLPRTRLQTALQRQALSFDGVDDYAEVPDSPELRPSALTIESLFLVFDYSSLRTVAGKWDGVGNASYVMDVYSTGKLRLGTHDGSTTTYLSSSTILETNKWIHAVAVYSAGTGKLYLNAVLDNQGSGLVQPMTTSTIEFKVAAQGATNIYPFYGYIAYVRVYNRALDKSEILHNYYYPDNPVTRGLVLWLAWDTISETTWTDKSGYGNDATVYGAVPVEYVRTPLRVLTSTREQAPTR